MEKYLVTNFASKREFEDAVMRDATLSDMEKLSYIFSACKDELKKTNPQLYYAILAVLDGNKRCTPPVSYFN